MAKTNDSNAGDEMDDNEVFNTTSKTKKGKGIDMDQFDLSDDELLKDIPKKSDLEAPPAIHTNPTETRVADETGAANTELLGEDGNSNDIGNNNNNTPPVTDGLEQEEKVGERSGDVTINIPKTEKQPTKDIDPKTTATTNTNKHQNNNTPPPKNDDEKFNVRLLDTGKSNTSDYDNIWNIDPEPAKTGGSTKTPGGSDSPGIERPEELSASTNEGLAKLAVMVFETKVIGALKNRALINMPKFMKDMMIARVREDVQNGFLHDVDGYNARVADAIQITAKEKALVKHCVLQILEKYPAIAEGFSPELQALIALGEMIFKYYNISQQWRDVQLDLLDKMDERIARAPKENVYTSGKEKETKKD